MPCCTFLDLQLRNCGSRAQQLPGPGPPSPRRRRKRPKRPKPKESAVHRCIKEHTVLIIWKLSIEVIKETYEELVHVERED